MTSPSEPPPGEPDEPVRLSKDPEPEAPFDPYRYGAPETPPPPEYAPPGWTPPPAGPPSAGAPSGPGYPPPPYAGGPGQQPPYPPNPYGPPPYGTPPYGPGRYPPPAQRSNNSKAVAALVLGVLTLLMFWTSIFDALLALPAVVFGILAVHEANRRGGAGRGMAIAGLVCGAIGAVLAIVWTAFIVHLANQCGGIDQTNRPGFEQCLRQHF